MNGIRMDNPSLYPVLLLVLAFFSFSSTNFLKGNGYLAVYITGLVLGNSKFPQRRSSMNLWMALRG
jgi:cell volume regulation protein A